METLVQSQQISVTELQPASEKLDASEKSHLVYKCLLNQHAQKLRKPAPMYQTANEGFEHQPRFRSTVWIDGVSYTSSNTFQHRRMAEMDAARVAYCAILQKSKDEALCFVQEDKLFCKSILSEYAAKMYIEKPNYETIEQWTSALGTIFRTNVVFNGVTYSGEMGKSKKEGEQLAARAAILKHLESKPGDDVLVETIHCKFRLCHSFASSTSGVRTRVDNNITLKEAKVESGSSTMHKLSVGMDSCLAQGITTPAVTQQPIPIVSVETVAPTLTESNMSISTAVPAPVIVLNTTSAELFTPPVVSAPCLGQMQMDNLPETHTSSEENSKAPPDRMEMAMGEVHQHE